MLFGTSATTNENENFLRRPNSNTWTLLSFVRISEPLAVNNLMIFFFKVEKGMTETSEPTSARQDQFVLRF